jgi:RHS repeat-associated protein
VCAVHAGEVRHYFYDGNGNVGQVVNEIGTIIARYEYDPFGNIVNGVSPDDSNPFRFSTKYFDAETGLYYYGFRYYSAELGRWWSRDPIGERGGINLYLLLSNNPISNYDLLGYVTVTQIAKVGYQLGLVSDPIVQASSNANFTNLNEKDLIKMNFSNLIKDIQSMLGLVFCQLSTDGYNFLNFIRASSVVNRHSALTDFLFLFGSQSAAFCFRLS